jgi:proteasome lid subunit RPN8/RPN11
MGVHMSEWRLVNVDWRQAVIDDIEGHMSADNKGESCGLVVRFEHGFHYIASVNLAVMDDEYLVDPELVDRYLERIVAVIHSHHNGSVELSQRDVGSAHPQFLYGVWALGSLWVYGYGPA